MTRKTKGFGWVPDLPDRRDHVYSAPAPVMAVLPKKVDLTKNCSPVLAQGELGSCTAHAIGSAFRYCLKRQKARDFQPSRLFIYYNERVVIGTVNEDSGAQIRDGIKSVVKQGVVPESKWPYVVSRFTKMPGAALYKEALEHQALSYQRLPRTLDQIKGCLASGYPFVFGFSVYESFQSAAVAKSGKCPMPKKNESLVGGHAVLAVGYDDKTKTVLVQNSWSEDWGRKGYFTMPYDYICDPDLCDDFWTIRIVED